MKQILTFSILLIATVALGQSVHVDSVLTLTTDTLTADPSPALPIWKTIFTFQNVLIAFAGLYEIAVRIYPTTKNLSALSLVYNIINMIIPNAKKDGTKHK